MAAKKKSTGKGKGKGSKSTKKKITAEDAVAEIVKTHGQGEALSAFLQSADPETLKAIAEKMGVARFGPSGMTMLIGEKLAGVFGDYSSLEVQMGIMLPGDPNLFENDVEAYFPRIVTKIQDTMNRIVVGSAPGGTKVTPPWGTVQTNQPIPEGSGTPPQLPPAGTGAPGGALPAPQTPVVGTPPIGGPAGPPPGGPVGLPPGGVFPPGPGQQVPPVNPEQQGEQG